MSDESSNSQNASNRANQNSDSARRNEAEVEPPASEASPTDSVHDQTASRANPGAEHTTPTAGSGITEEQPINAEQTAEAEVPATKEREQTAQREADEAVYAASR
jgi:hypothetical protein